LTDTFSRGIHVDPRQIFVAWSAALVLGVDEVVKTPAGWVLDPLSAMTAARAISE
jgi:hypothetical protein